MGVDPLPLALKASIGTPTGVEPVPLALETSMIPFHHRRMSTIMKSYFKWTEQEME
jgi:hypothetical protein